MVTTHGPLIIVSGPSGCGKSSIIARLLADSPWPLHLAVSATTRAARPGERDGVQYFFWPRERFDREIEAGGFLEWAEVFGHRYGTLRQEVEPFRERGMGVLLEIDVAGRQQVIARCPEAVSIFVRTASPMELEQRLRRRGTETEESMQRRLRGAAAELARSGAYDHQLVNDDLDVAVAQLRAIVDPLFERQNQNG